VNDKFVYPYRNLAVLLRKKIDFYSKLFVVHRAEIVDPFFGPIFSIKNQPSDSGPPTRAKKPTAPLMWADEKNYGPLGRECFCYL
jgi:hypothetical protein